MSTGKSSRADVTRRRPSSPGLARMGLSVGLVALLVAAAMVAWWPTYESREFVIAAVAAIVGGAAVGVAGTLLRWPSWTVLLAVVGVYLVLGVPVAVPSRAFAVVLPTPAGLVELVAGTALSWKQLVTIATPVGSYQALLVPPFLLGLLVTTLAVTIALRTRRPSLALLPPTVLLVAGIALGVVHDDVAVEAGLTFLIATVTWLVWVGVMARRQITATTSADIAFAEVRRIVGATAILAIAVALGAVAAVAAPAGARSVVRSELQPPFEPQDQVSPLVGFRAAFDEESEQRQMLRVTGLPDGAGLRIAALDTYDGIVYSVGGADGSGVSGRFTRVPYRLDQSSANGSSVRIEVEVLGYADVWVPGIGRLERISFDGPRAATLAEGYHYNDTTGTGAVVGGLRSGDAYVATSIAPPEPDSLAELQAGTSAVPDAPPLPEELGRLLDLWAPSGTQGEKLAAVRAGFLREGFVSHGRDDEPPSRSGHSLDRIVELETERPMVGDGEQYAVAMAMMARAIGFPARVVVGYRADSDVDSDGDGTDRERPDSSSAPVVLSSDDLRAWVEVQSTQGGWVTVDPNPDERPVPEREPDQPNVVSRPQSELPPPEERTRIDEVASDPQRNPDDSDDSGAEWLEQVFAVLRIVGIGAGVLALIASPFAAIVIAKLRRRHVRRSAESAVERIEGGWLEFADTAVDYGYPVRATATRAEQASTVGGLGPLVLASVVDRAVFAPDGPDVGDDERVWSAVDELQARLSAPRSRLERLRAATSLRSLGDYAGSRRGVR